MKAGINLIVLTIFALASINGLMQEKLVPLETVVFGCEFDDSRVCLSEGGFPYQTSPAYFCKDKE